MRNLRHSSPTFSEKWKMKAYKKGGRKWNNIRVHCPVELRFLQLLFTFILTSPILLATCRKGTTIVIQNKIWCWLLCSSGQWYRLENFSFFPPLFHYHSFSLFFALRYRSLPTQHLVFWPKGKISKIFFSTKWTGSAAALQHTYTSRPWCQNYLGYKRIQFCLHYDFFWIKNFQFPLKNHA